ncbi:MAG: FAD-dependent oxidoreductase [Anaerovoracaceae bacterium]|jgi:NADPH-dependent 2,4-dienoyl-CoA reductase/sulfur reductase-like enzyme/rhodanese-related sulfurtransferase
MKVVIVGGVAGGANAAARIRRLDEAAEIVIFERTGYISYANCGLPYYAGGVIEDRNELTLQTPHSFWQRFRIDVRVHHEVQQIDTEKKTVSVKDLESGEVSEEAYDKLILAPGASPIVPPFEGTDSERLFTLRTVEDTLKIREFILREKPQSVVLAGGGYIGLEMAENLRETGMEVTIVQRPDQLLASLDYDMATLVHACFRSHGVKVMTGTSVAGFKDEDGGITTLLEGREPLKSDMVVLAIGVRPETGLAGDQFSKGIKGSLAVNEKMETGVPDVYALGDAVQVKNLVTGKPAVIALAGPANRQGRLVGDQICRGQGAYLGSQGSSVVKLFRMTVATTGINERTAAAEGIEYERLVLSPSSHATYYPGASVMTIKLIYEKGSLRILGAQIVGYEGVDKRIDVIATAIFAGLKVTQLKDLDLAYAPPYSSAKDPVNMAGFMAENIEDGLVKQFYWEEIEGLRKREVTLLDVRTPEEYAEGAAAGFRNIPLDELRERLNEVPQDKPVYVMCQSGQRSYIACRLLSQKGYDCYNFSGGYRFYQSIFDDREPGSSAYPCGRERSDCGNADADAGGTGTQPEGGSKDPEAWLLAACPICYAAAKVKSAVSKRKSR